MKILTITAQRPDSTGSGVYLSELMKAFQKKGISQHLICGIHSGTGIDLPHDIGCTAVYFNTEALPFPVAGMSDEMPYESTRYCDFTEEMLDRFTSAFSNAITKAIADFSPDVIICHHLYIVTALTAELSGNIPAFAVCHGSDLRQIRKNPLKREWIKIRIRDLTGIFALHDEQKELISSYYDYPIEEISVIGTGYDKDTFYVRESLKTKNSDELRLVFAGKISKKKGIESLIRSLSYIDPAEEKIRLTLIGSSGNKTEYEAIRADAEMCPHKVIFTGRLPYHYNVAEEFNNNDVFVLPSFYEGLPLVLIEAMACGLPVICTDLPGIQNWIKAHGLDKYAVFVDPPVMHNEDEPEAGSLSLFENALAHAVLNSKKLPIPDPERISKISWDGLSERILRYMV